MAENVERSPEEIAAHVAKLDAETAHLTILHRKELALAETAEIQLITLQRDSAHHAAKNRQQRVYDFISTVNDATVEDCVQTLAAWARVSASPITLTFHSPGGAVLAGLRLYDFLASLREGGIALSTVTLGYAASMAGILLQAGARRVIGPNAYLLVHEVSSGAVGKIGELEDSVEFTKQLNDRLFGILASRAKVSKKALLNKARRKDVWISAADAVDKFGLADEIGFR